MADGPGWYQAPVTVDVGSVRGSEGLARVMAMPEAQTVVDVGSGAGEQAALLRKAGFDVCAVDLAPPADHVGDFMTFCPSRRFDIVWACHVLEHQPDPQAFLRKCRSVLVPGGSLAVTVPPLKHEIVGGHVTLWNAGLLLYQLILAGFDCRQAMVGTYASGPGFPPYNITAIVQRPLRPIRLPDLRMDCGDIETLAPFFPVPVEHGFDGRLPNINW